MRCSGMNHLHRQEPKELGKVNHSRDGQSRNVQFVAAVDHSSETSQGREITLGQTRSEEHTSELQSLMRISYAVFCLKKKTTQTRTTHYSTARHIRHLFT